MDFFSIINYAALIDKLLLFLINAVGLELILWIYVANRYTRPNHWFLVTTLYVLFWIDLDFAATLAPEFLAGVPFQDVALWATRGVYALLAVFIAAFRSYSLNFPVKNHLDKKKRGRENLQIALWAFFFVASFTPLIVREVMVDAAAPMVIWVKTGILAWIYAGAALLTIVISYFDLMRNRILADYASRERARIIALGAGVFGIFNFLFNIAGPILGERFGYGNFFSLLADCFIAGFLGYIAYRAMRDELFEVKVILVEIFVGLMGASLAVMPFFVNVLWQQVLLAMLFALFCAFGVVLVKSTIKEYREREMLEQKVLERTAQLEHAKQNLEEINSALEVRVKARTRELEKLNQTLEEKVTERTNDLETKIKDLELFQRLTVGRELKMIELKNEIENLRATIAKMESAQTAK